MLSECNAFIIAPSTDESRPLEAMARRVGFGDVGSSFSPRRLTHGLTFFVLHYRLSEATMLGVIEQLRGSEDRDTRYAPILLITDDCPVDRLLHYIQLGFDDVIALPEKREVLESRLASQLNTDQAYFETPDYLGPDRRRMELTQHRDDRRTGVAAFARLTIRRDPTQGIVVLRRQMVTVGTRARPDESTHYMPRQFTPGAAANRFPA